ncbi:unnamed protein product [Ixodes hexagonus]
MRRVTRRRRTSSNEKLDTDDDRKAPADVPQFRATLESAATGSAPWETAHFVRLLRNMSAKLDVLTAEVRSLKAENTFLRSEMGLLNKRVLERLPLVAIPQASFSAAVLSSESTVGRPPLSAEVVQQSTLGEGATPGPKNSSAKGVVPAISSQVPRLRRDARPAAAAPYDGFTPVMRRRRSPTSTGTAKSEKVLAVPRPPPMKALFVFRLDPSRSVSDIEDLITSLLDSKCASVTKLKPKFHFYSSFHIAGDQSVFEILNKSELWPEGSEWKLGRRDQSFINLFGKLDSSRVYEAESTTSVNAS